MERLRDAGGVLVAKLSMGALAQGGVWFGGSTRNPWSPDNSSSGSSAGPGAATAAGLVALADRFSRERVRTESRVRRRRWWPGRRDSRRGAAARRSAQHAVERRARRPAHGAKLEPMSLPEFLANALGFILSAEAAAAFDDLTRSNRIFVEDASAPEDFDW